MNIPCASDLLRDESPKTKHGQLKLSARTNWRLPLGAGSYAQLINQRRVIKGGTVKSRKLKSKWYQGILLLVAAMVFAAGLPEAQSQAVHGSGTTNQIPLWTSSSAIGNSALSQSGGNLTTSGSITALSFAGDGSALNNVNAAKLGGILPSGFAQLNAASNTFTGSISASTVNSTNPYQIGGTNVLSVGSQNLFVGQSAGASNTTGFDNTASGYQALFSNTTGFVNTD